ncbi:VPS5A [Auxenochlorella protothecoides x Auxenochlorella symbiontica]
MGTDLHAGRADHSVDPLSQGEARGSLDDPPPYESIIMGTARDEPASRGPDVAGKQPLEAAITVFVTDPVRQLEGVRSFVSYRVTYRPASGPGSSVHPAGVIRRFSDFDWLKKQLRANHRGCIVPPLPEKNVVEKYKLTDEFIEQRRAALAVFMNRLAAHPVLRHSPALQLFLDADEAGFAREVARTAGEAGGAGVLAAAASGSPAAAVASAVSLLRSLGASASGLVSRQLAPPSEEEEDGEYLRVRGYLHRLERHVAEVHGQAARLARHQAALADALTGFGEAVADLGADRESCAPRELAALSERSEAAASAARGLAARLAREVEAPLKEAARALLAVQRATADRSAALAALSSARADVDARRSRLARLRGTPGIREERVAEAERDLAHAQRKADAAKEVYNAIATRMSSELVAFQRQRAEELSAVLRRFATLVAAGEGAAAKTWAPLARGADT